MHSYLNRDWQLLDTVQSSMIVRSFCNLSHRRKVWGIPHINVRDLLSTEAFHFAMM